MSAPTPYYFCATHRYQWDHAYDCLGLESYAPRAERETCVKVQALVLLRDEEGNWPAGIIQTMLSVDDFEQHYADADDCRRMLDALAAASQEGKA